MKALFKRVRASGMIEAIFISMLVMIGCYTIVRVTRYGQKQLMHMQNNMDSDADLYFVIDCVSRNLDWPDYPDGMTCKIIETCKQYEITYKNKKYMVNMGTNGQFVGKCIGKC